MHPYYSHMGHWHRGPSRLLWFFFGGLAATWWIKHKDADRRVFGHCMRPPVQAPPTDSAAPPSPWPQNMSDIPRAINNIPPAHSSPVSAEWESRQWEQEKEHLANISRQATDAMADLTEATLETVLSTAESLKAKLAEHRAQREKQQKVIDQRLEEERRSPPRLV
ncbi:hypothetical protein GALMADRAFT_240790 [Galerina marginata CBS 339.88]|uniref:Uncharacterized protein n=1 Tax=Galerina marginata (strain CBS 339.88) TaxID=685588 RepID=A0A067TNI0_GALM3|nr:hypothetical protein GALMADRAFT_240790 [Galerina marginata CBS 339.88]